MVKGVGKKIAIVGVLSICILGMAGCETWDRTVKNYNSSVDGLNRDIKVYSHDGNLIKEYKGKVDIQSNEYGNKVKFDLNGKRVIINNAIVVSEEE